LLIIFSLIDTELLAIPGGKLTESEGPTVEARTEGNCTLVGVDLDITKSRIVVGRYEHID
jgi:hypothetical protein